MTLPPPPSQESNSNFGELPDAGWKFDNSYARLPELFFVPVKPAHFPQPSIYLLNTELANELGLDFSRFSSHQLANLFAGQQLPIGAETIAQAYAGHQFGGFTLLGDGRALLLGEHRTHTGKLVDIQFKGSGQTPFSRRGDGRAALAPMLREYIISEAMHRLGIPTTRSLAVATTGEPVYRESVLRGAVLTRVAASHIRVGTFQYVATRKEISQLQLLADYTIARHYPDLANAEEKYLQLLMQVAERQASLISKWQGVGFIHGVMNTDNMSIAGETIDYGPCAFMNDYHPETVFSSIDDYGRYAYGNQPVIGQWNLARFAETLLPLIHPLQEKAIEAATKVIHEFPPIYERYWLNSMRAKIGLAIEHPDDLALIHGLLEVMQTSKLDFVNTFRDLGDPSAISSPTYQIAAFQNWYTRWQQRLSAENQSFEVIIERMNRVNPYFIPRNHKVEEALSAAEQNDNLEPLKQLLAVLSKPYESRPELAEYRQPPPATQACYQTFCGT